MAKLSDIAQLDVANKLSLGIVSTNTDKNYFEEDFAWTPTVLASEIWADDVPFASTPAEADAVATATAATDGPLVEKYTLAIMDEAPLSNGQGWAVYATPGVTTPSTRVVDWLNPQLFGPGYFFQLYENDNTPIALTDGRYQVDSKNGIVRFDEGFTPADLGLLTPLKITFYRYNGRKGVVVDVVPGGGGNTGGYVPHQEIVSFTDVGPMDTNTVVGSVSFAVVNPESFRLYLNKLFLVQGQDYNLTGTFGNQIEWLVENTGVTLSNADGDQLVALYSEEGVVLPYVPRQQELMPQDVGPTDGDVILTDILDVGVNNPHSVRLFHNKLLQVQGSGRDYSLTGPGYRQIIWQPEGSGSGTAQTLQADDELVALFLQDADTAFGPTGPTGPIGPMGITIQFLDDLTDVEADGTFAPEDGDVLTFVGGPTDGFWTPTSLMLDSLSNVKVDGTFAPGEGDVLTFVGGVWVPTTLALDLQGVLAVGNITGGSDIIISTGDQISGETVLTLEAGGGSNIDIGTSANTGTINIGTGTTARIVNIGNIQNTSQTNILGGSAGINITGNSVGVIDIQANANVTVTSTANQVVLRGGSIATNSVRIWANNAAGGITLDSGTNGTTVNTTGNITFNALSMTSPITLNQGGDLDLSGFTATSIIGALNELKNTPSSTQITNGTAITIGDVDTAGTWTANLNERVIYDPSGGTFIINAPASPSIGDKFAVKNRTSNLTAVTISGNGNNIEDPTSSFGLSASFSLSGDGISVEWEFDGTQWLVI